MGLSWLVTISKLTVRKTEVSQGNNIFIQFVNQPKYTDPGLSSSYYKKNCQLLNLDTLSNPILKHHCEHICADLRGKTMVCLFACFSDNAWMTNSHSMCFTTFPKTLNVAINFMRTARFPILPLNNSKSFQIPINVVVPVLCLPLSALRSIRYPNIPIHIVVLNS